MGEGCSWLAPNLLTILLPPRMKMVTALEFLHCSMTSILSLVVPKEISFTSPAKPNFSGVSSEKRGTIRPPVAMAISCGKGIREYFRLQQLTCPL